MSTIYAKATAINILDKMDYMNIVHSIFQNGINIKSSYGLIFIGTNKNGYLPFGIHLGNGDIPNILETEIGNIFHFNSEDRVLSSNDIIIDLNQANYYSTSLSNDKRAVKTETLEYVSVIIKALDIYTGLDIKLKALILEDNQPIEALRSSLKSKDEEYIKYSFKKIIGRGQGLTPSGDDLLIGLLWVNEIRKIIGNKCLEYLKELIVSENLTTDVSVNYYKAAFSGEYSSKLIELCDSLLSEDENRIKIAVLSTMDSGHSSGSDTLAGIALGIEIIMEDKGRL